jgi:hypothetical protein
MVTSVPVCLLCSLACMMAGDKLAADHKKVNATMFTG